MITRNPETFRREAGNSAEDRDDREGHPVANHSLTQVDVGNTSNWGARRELTITDHFIRDVTGKEVEHFLLYGGNETQSTQDLVEGLKRSQRDCDFGASCDFDSNDWRYAAHELKGRDAAPPTERAELPAPLHEAGGTDGEGKKAIEEVGGSIDVTFVQDWDLSLFLHRAAWRVTCDDEATAYREIFENADALHQQRTRSTFGSLQAVWKHHHLRVRWVTNCWARACCRNMPLPSSFPSSSSLVVVHGHPDSSRGGHDVVLFYFLLFLVARRTIAAPGLVMMREKWRRLWMVPAYHCPQRAVACLPAMHNRLYGHPLGHDRLERACAQRKIGHRFWVTVQLRRTSIVVTGGADR